MGEQGIAYELMERSLRRAFTGGAVEGLFGSGPERAVSAYRRLLAPGSNHIVFLEFPLHGTASYDVFVGAIGDGVAPQGRLPEENPPVARAAYAWAGGWGRGSTLGIHFELDADGPGSSHVGMHLGHMGDLAAMADFFQVIGEGWRAKQYLAVAERLPRGWSPSYAGAFTGRPGTPTRLELYLSPEESARVARDPGYLGSCLDQVGFRAHDGQMIADASAIVRVRCLNSLQLDILGDGTLKDTISVTSSCERTTRDFGRLFQDGGLVARLCGLYERMGVADARWRLIEQTLFADKRVVAVGDERRWARAVSRPIGGKAKWVGARPQPAKFYLSQMNALGPRWALDCLVDPS